MHLVTANLLSIGDPAEPLDTTVGTPVEKHCSTLSRCYNRLK